MFITDERPCAPSALQLQLLDPALHDSYMDWSSESKAVRDIYVMLSESLEIEPDTRQGIYEDYRDYCSL